VCQLVVGSIDRDTLGGVLVGHMRRFERARLRARAGLGAGVGREDTSLPDAKDHCALYQVPVCICMTAETKRAETGGRVRLDLISSIVGRRDERCLVFPVSLGDQADTAHKRKGRGDCAP
jgi:hypothetical protein